MKNSNKIITFCLGLGLFVSCNDFIDADPNAIAQKNEITDPESYVNAAYSSLGNDHYDTPLSLWPYGNTRSDDAYKGGGGTWDIEHFHFYETSTNISSDFGEPDALWFSMYVAISRANQALAFLETVSEADFPKKGIRMGEMRFLRGHFYFMLKIVFKNIPYVDDKLSYEDYYQVSNVALSNDELWEKIALDFEYAYNTLPDAQFDKGRVDKYAAAAYLAKVYLYKAYRQDNPNRENNVTSIQADDLNKVVKYTQEVMDSQYALESDFAYNFLPGSYQNGVESIFAVQYSQDDGTKFGRLNFGDLLSNPQFPLEGGGTACCDFNKPSQNLVNAFKTQNGLPLFTEQTDNYNASDYNSLNDNADPRLFHTVAMDGFPYKYNLDNLFKDSWNREPGVYGHFASLKENVDPTCDCFVALPPFYGNSKNRIIIRFADILLMQAEALIELNRQAEALPLINKVRERAKKSAGLIAYAPKLDIASYQPGVNCQAWTPGYARRALRWERRLEFAMENSRFFDLVRWGISDQVINAYYQTESSKRDIFKSASFTKNKNEYVPIPQQQIRLSMDLYKPNFGWK